MSECIYIGRCSSETWVRVALRTWDDVCWFRWKSTGLCSLHWAPPTNKTYKSNSTPECRCWVELILKINRVNVYIYFETMWNKCFINVILPSINYENEIANTSLKYNDVIHSVILIYSHCCYVFEASNDLVRIPFWAISVTSLRLLR